MAGPDLLTVNLMQPTLIAKLFHRAGWVYEEKYDGWRVVAYQDGRVTRLALAARTPVLAVSGFCGSPFPSAGDLQNPPRPA